MYSIFPSSKKALTNAWTAAAAKEKNARLKAQETAATKFNTNAGKDLAATAKSMWLCLSNIFWIYVRTVWNLWVQIKLKACMHFRGKNHLKITDQFF